LANALDKYKMSYLSNQLRHLDDLTAQLYEVEYVLSNDCMTLPL